MADRRNPRDRATRSPGGRRPGQKPQRSASGGRPASPPRGTSPGAATSTGPEAPATTVPDSTRDSGAGSGEPTEALEVGTLREPIGDSGQTGDTSLTEVIVDPSQLIPEPVAERPAAPAVKRGQNFRTLLSRPRLDRLGLVGSGPGSERMARLLEARASGRQRGRTRFTGRAAVLVLVLAVLTVSYASSLRAYVQQRAHLTELRADIAEREANIAALDREKQRWEDPAYVRTQARSQLGYLMPGELGFQVLDPDGEPLDKAVTLREVDDVIKKAPTPWWDDAWASVELAGNPPVIRKNDPNAEINGTKKNVSEGRSTP